AKQPAPRPSWWQRLAALLEPPKLRWVAIGVTASLLLAIGAAQYAKLRPAVVDDGGKISQVTPPSPEAGATQSTQPPQQNVGTTSPKAKETVRHASSTKQHLAQARLQKERELRAEGEAAKEKLMFALSIASATLNDAQKAVHDDGPKPQLENNK